METIFVVVHGYDYEGENILSLCKTKIKADSIVKNYIDSDMLPEYNSWKLNDTTWKRGCEYLRIYEMTVED